MVSFLRARLCALLLILLTARCRSSAAKDLELLALPAAPTRHPATCNADWDGVCA